MKLSVKEEKLLKSFVFQMEYKYKNLKLLSQLEEYYMDNKIKLEKTVLCLHCSHKIWIHMMFQVKINTIIVYAY
jgi:hypothetical protein